MQFLAAHKSINFFIGIDRFILKNVCCPSLHENNNNYGCGRYVICRAALRVCTHARAPKWCFYRRVTEIMPFFQVIDIFTVHSKFHYGNVVLKFNM